MDTIRKQGRSLSAPKGKVTRVCIMIMLVFASMVQPELLRYQSGLECIPR